MRYSWQAGSGRPLYLIITKDEADSCSHAGQCSPDVNYLLAKEHIASQTFDMWEPGDLKAELLECGAWEHSELMDFEANVERMLWIACNDVSENPEMYAEDDQQ